MDQVICPWCPTIFDIDSEHEAPYDEVMSHFEFGHGREWSDFLEEHLYGEH